jgi:hypothetical protein
MCLSYGHVRYNGQIVDGSKGEDELARSGRCAHRMMPQSMPTLARYANVIETPAAALQFLSTAWPDSLKVLSVQNPVDLHGLPINIRPGSSTTQRTWAHIVKVIDARGTLEPKPFVHRRVYYEVWIRYQDRSGFMQQTPRSSRSLDPRFETANSESSQSITSASCYPTMSYPAFTPQSLDYQRGSALSNDPTPSNSSTKQPCPAKLAEEGPAEPR